MSALLRKPLVAGAVVLAIYVALSFLMDPRGYLGTDTGAKVATLEVMTQRGSWRPEVGYWAERWDPDGGLHPLTDTMPIEGEWVNVTTLPMLELGYPLYRLGGYRLALLLPMLASLAAAFSARALVRRIRGPGAEGWDAYWIVALGSPLVVYALDFWEHAPGVALMAWAVVFLLDFIEGRKRARVLVAVGVLFGLSASMRTETFVYAAVIGAVTGLLLLLRRVGIGRIAAGGAAFVVGFSVSWAANVGLEKALGGQSRAQRASGVVSAGAGAGGRSATHETFPRLHEGLLASFGLRPSALWSELTFGALAMGLLIAAVAVERRGERRMLILCLTGVALLYALARSEGLGFIPGFMVAFPFAAVGLAYGWRRGSSRTVLLFGLLPLPVVWAYQYTGGAAPQWGGRYVLTSGLLLGVVGIAALDGRNIVTKRATMALTVVVTALGVLWLGARSHDVDKTFTALTNRPEQVIISARKFLIREGGPRYSERRWLTAPYGGDVNRALGVAKRAGLTSAAVFDIHPLPTVDMPGVRLVREERGEFLGSVLYIDVYRIE